MGVIDTVGDRDVMWAIVNELKKLNDSIESLCKSLGTTSEAPDLEECVVEALAHSIIHKEE